MKLLTLVRHAKSSWQQSHQNDHQRPLNNRGRRDAPTMAARLMARGTPPDKVLCSTAARTRETLQLFTETCGFTHPRIEFQESLYLASKAQLAASIELVPAKVEHLMLIAHNPGLEQLLMELAQRTGLAMPTCAMAGFALPRNTFELNEQAELLWFDFPKSDQGKERTP